MENQAQKLEGEPMGSAVDIAKLQTPRSAYPHSHNDIPFVSMDDYLLITRKLISTIAPTIKSGLAGEILRSEDAISNIATSVMLADWKWNGKGTRRGYRSQCAYWAILRYVTRATTDNHTLSIDWEYNNDSADIFCGTTDRNLQNIAARDEVRYLLSLDVLNQRQRLYLTNYYLDGMTLAEVGSKYNISREAVRQVVERALNKLRKHMMQKEKV